MTFAATGNYEAVTVQSGPFTVAQRRITATWKGLDTVYSLGLPQSPEIAGLVGVVPADQGKVTVLTQTTEQTDAGSYPGAHCPAFGREKPQLPPWKRYGHLCDPSGGGSLPVVGKQPPL